jgi:hypothetical protein
MLFFLVPGVDCARFASKRAKAQLPRTAARASPNDGREPDGWRPSIHLCGLGHGHRFIAPHAGKRPFRALTYFVKTPGVIAGASTPEQVDVKAVTCALTREELAKVEAIFGDASKP